jgi:large subunit ribosomal protein L15
VNVSRLSRFDDGTRVTPDLLKSEGIVKQAPGGGVKILGNGTITAKLTVCADAFSRTAVEKIEAAGGTVELRPGPKPPVRRKLGRGRHTRRALRDGAGGAAT